jgi:hypothetical protein
MMGVDRIVTPILFLVLASCSSNVSRADQLTAMAAEKAWAEPVPGWAAVAAKKPKYVIFGELHGTKESPQFIAKLASGLANQGKRILVAVELSANTDLNVQKAWAGSPADFAATLTATGWAGRNDGVTSAAMLDMLTQLHLEKSHGASIAITAFNGARDDAQSERLNSNTDAGHEATQAENIVQAANRGQYDYVLILVGNAHAMKKEITFTGSPYKPMAMHLERVGKTISLAMDYGSGTAWNCQLPAGFQVPAGQAVTWDMPSCANHPTSSNAEPRNGPQIVLGAKLRYAEARAFDGIYWVGPITGSVPALPK